MYNQSKHKSFNKAHLEMIENSELDSIDKIELILRTSNIRNYSPIDLLQHEEDQLAFAEGDSIFSSEWTILKNRIIDARQAIADSDINAACAAFYFLGKASAMLDADKPDHEEIIAGHDAIISRMKSEKSLRQIEIVKKLLEKEAKRFAIAYCDEENWKKIAIDDRPRTTEIATITREHIIQTYSNISASQTMNYKVPKLMRIKEWIKDDLPEWAHRRGRDRKKP